MTGKDDVLVCNGCGKEVAIEAHVLAGNDGSGKFGHGERKGSRRAEFLEDCFRKGSFCVGIERDVVAGVAAKLTEGGNVRANNATAGHQCFDDRKAEALNGGRRDDCFAVAITPVELRFGEALTEKDEILQTRSANRLEDAAGLRTGNADDDQARGWSKAFAALEMLEDSDEEWDVLVTAMLCNTEQEGFTAPAGK